MKVTWIQCSCFSKLTSVVLASLQISVSGSKNFFTFIAEEGTDRRRICWTWGSTHSCPIFPSCKKDSWRKLNFPMNEKFLLLEMQHLVTRNHVQLRDISSSSNNSQANFLCSFIYRNTLQSSKMQEVLKAQCRTFCEAPQKNNLPLWHQFDAAIDNINDHTVDTW